METASSESIPTLSDRRFHDDRRQAVIIGFPTEMERRKRAERRAGRDTETVVLQEGISESPTLGELALLPSYDKDVEAPFSGAPVEAAHSTELANVVFDYYMNLRAAAAKREKPKGEELSALQDDVRTWIESENIISGPTDYENYDRTIVERKVGGLTKFLEHNHAGQVSAEEILATKAFVSSTFMMYEGRNKDASPAAEGDGTFAFVVPARMSRHNTEYGEEVEPVVPLMRYVPNELRAQMMIGFPPFVIDRYKKDERGGRGYLVFAPVYGDMAEDLGRAKFFSLAKKHVNNAVDFAVGRFGVNTVGLGATLPALTHFGRDISNPNVRTTTGHGGTTHLIKETVTAAIEQGYVNGTENPRIGVLGLGSIGASIAELVASEFPANQLTIYDTVIDKTNRTQANLSLLGMETKAACDEEHLLDNSDIVISAITTRLSLDKMNVDLSHKIIIDDSQPGSFDPEEVKDHGGQLTWVIGRDKRNRIARNGYDYGTLVDPQHDLFGCEAEAATLAEYSRDLEDREFPADARERILSKLALRSAVTPKQARLIGGLFKKYGVEVAKFQNFGEYIDQP